MTSRSIGAGADRGSGPLARQLRTLFAAGSFAGLTDGELLDRYLDRGRSRPEADAEAAFAALVDRHGPMVRRSCRAILGNASDADDAFQGVFLLLARKARSLRSRESVAPWLVETSRRVCRKLLVAASRRRSHEARASLPADAPTTDLDPASLDDRAVLLAEINRLPPSFRAPILLCALEGRTAADASRLLGVAEGTIHSRLSRGRALLRSRLSRRGLAFVPLPITRIPSFLPERLVNAAVRNASLLSAGRLGAIEAPAVVLSLIVSTSRRTLMHSTLLLSLVSAAALGPIAAGWGPLAPPDEPANAPFSVQSPSPEKAPQASTLEVLIVEEDGTPAPSAVLRVRGEGVQGEFRADDVGRIVVPTGVRGTILIAERPAASSFDAWGEPRPHAVAIRSHVVGTPTDEQRDSPFKLVLRTMGPPSTIRVVDEDGKPVADARVFVSSVAAPEMVTLEREESRSLFGDLVTDANGVVPLRSPANAKLYVNAAKRYLTGSVAVVRSDTHTHRPIVLHPCGEISGVVTDSRTGEPVMGAGVYGRRIETSSDSSFIHVFLQGTTGPDGRYVLPEAPPGVYLVGARGEDGREARGIIGIRVVEGRDVPADLSLESTRVVTGQVVRADNGRPVNRVVLSVQRAEGSGWDWEHRGVQTDHEGRYRMPLIPGTYRIRSNFSVMGLREHIGLAAITHTMTVPDDDLSPISFNFELQPAAAPPIQSTSSWQSTLAITVLLGAEATMGLGQLCTQFYWGDVSGPRTLRGRVVDEHGTPLPGVRVWNLSQQEQATIDRNGNLLGISMLGFNAITDRDGQYLLKGQPEGPLKLRLYSFPGGIRRETVAAGVTEVDFVLPLRR